MANDTNNKKYYWLKLDRHFFRNARVRKLRKLAGGDTFTIIYLKLMLLSIEYEGILIYEGIEESFEKEMALKIEEETENVHITINYLRSQGLLVEKDGDGFLPDIPIGSETQSNVYKKEKRLEKFQSTSNQIPIDIRDNINKEIYKDKELNNSCSFSDEKNECDTTKPIQKDSVKELNALKANLFEEFWKEYPRKVSKKTALKAYLKAVSGKVEQIVKDKAKTVLQGLQTAKTVWQAEKKDIQYIPHASSWLNAERWKDESDNGFESGNSLEDEELVYKGVLKL